MTICIWDEPLLIFLGLLRGKLTKDVLGNNIYSNIDSKRGYHRQLDNERREKVLMKDLGHRKYSSEHNLTEAELWRDATYHWNLRALLSQPHAGASLKICVLVRFLYESYMESTLVVFVARIRSSGN